MTRIIVSPKADADWSDIPDHLTSTLDMRWPSDMGRTWMRSTNNLMMFPAMGAPRPRYGRRTRIVVLSPYLVIYDHVTEADAVQIVRILDGRRNIKRRLVRQ